MTPSAAGSRTSALSPGCMRRPWYFSEKEVHKISAAKICPPGSNSVQGCGNPAPKSAHSSPASFVARITEGASLVE
eukprot:CAMPEP_0115159438 /NCGR_PEP_ID=MMETSP0227-20121206/70195_1 /TAXON_ID=89957 /ORGANISM="Polarella glacialis, Strain CCMP 1383" /LENGTH=75 /DNA_ID=CAMNT_0002571115 /DNA_START=107 /DNA_END=331 /DNA_ORIENTATION=-